jgi:hypothetical protein
MSRPSFHGDRWDRDDPEFPPTVPGSPADAAIPGDDPWEKRTEPEPELWNDVTADILLPAQSIG